MSLINSITIDRSIKFFGKTDGRDKFAKTLQNYCRFLTWYLVGAQAKKAKKIQSSLSEFRSLIKFFKWLKSYKEIREALSEGNLGFGGMIEMMGTASDMGYKLGDNIEYLSAYQLLSFDPKKCERISKIFQFMAYTFDLLADFIAISKLSQEKKNNDKKKKKMMLTVTQDACDWLRTLPGFLAIMEIGGVKKHNGWSGVFGTIAGLLGVYKVWKKCE